MTTFLLDLWQDLRAKRLWPVAVGLVVATLAVPVLLFKPASTPPPATGAGQGASASKLPSVALDASSIDSSHLDVFSQKNPFASGGDKVSATVAAATGTGAAVGAAGNASGSASGAGSASTASTTTSGGSSGGSSGSGGSSTAGPDGKPASPGLHYFTYTADVRFGKRGHVKTYKSVSELDLLPNGNTPIVSFMGVKDGKTAMFFVADTAYSADGEGRCEPTPQNCMFIFLKTDSSHNEETLTAQNGQIEYTLKLTALHVKTLNKDEALGSTTPDKSGSHAAATKSSKKAAQLRAKEHATLLAMPALGVARR